MWERLTLGAAGLDRSAQLDRSVRHAVPRESGAASTEPCGAYSGHRAVPCASVTRGLHGRTPQQPHSGLAPRASPPPAAHRQQYADPDCTVRHAFTSLRASAQRTPDACPLSTLRTVHYRACRISSFGPDVSGCPQSAVQRQRYTLSRLQAGAVCATEAARARPPLPPRCALRWGSGALALAGLGAWQVAWRPGPSYTTGALAALSLARSCLARHGAAQVARSRPHRE
mmetsp:Transcript_15587/g.50888  ORF Transcript_15587/g.50888 Transcript_15587/m.50888 type:complete len:228 (+) Transcript_15587:420-1103(+)